MRYRVIPRGPDLLVVEVEGDLDILTVPVLDAWVEATPASHVVLDLSGVAFLDSTAVAFFLRLQARLLGWRRRLALAGVSRRAARVFALMGIEDWLPIHPSVAEAAASVRAGLAGGSLSA